MMSSFVPIPPGYGQPGDSYEDSGTSSEETPGTVPPPLSSLNAATLAPPPVMEPPVPGKTDAGNTVVSATPQWGEEDATSFERSDIALNILLFREDGHPDGRLVQISVHNFARVNASGTYRARQLTQESSLDQLQQGLSQVVQQFWMRLADAQKKALEAAAATARKRPAVSPVPHTATSSPPAASGGGRGEVPPPASAFPGSLPPPPVPPAASMPSPQVPSSQSGKQEQYQLF
ncbi:MAG TPA: hypothetical protein VFV38_03790 [Ktedonobacteraceae bacterium]|nr:hypothetical protein [Ktedonobacteraceae bacterium]